MEVLVPLWQTFVSSLGVYEKSSIEGIEDSYDGRYDSDGSETSLESFIIQLFEFLLTIVGHKKFVKVHAWSMDANQYVDDEDENTYSCRLSDAQILKQHCALVFPSKTTLWNTCIQPLHEILSATFVRSD